MRHVIEEGFPLPKRLDQGALATCLLCRGCISACPPGIKTDELVSRARAEIVTREGQSWLLTLLFRQLLSSPRRLDRFAKAVRLIQLSGLQRLAEATGMTRLLGALGRAVPFLPTLPQQTAQEMMATVNHNPERPRGRVAYFIGCLPNTLYPDVVLATRRVLWWNDIAVEVPRVVCCGVPPHSFGDFASARLLARRNIQILKGVQAEAIVTDCASCSAFLKDYVHLLADDPQYVKDAAALSAKVRHISEYLSEIGWQPPVGELKQRVTYHDPCHLVHHQKIAQQPRAILKSIPGLTFVECPEPTMCCGGAGAYFMLQTELSLQILERKMGNLATTQANIVATENPSCLLQLAYGARRFNPKLRVRHTMQLLDEAYNGRG